MQWTCIECGDKYTDTTGDVDARTCDNCLEEEDNEV